MCAFSLYYNTTEYTDDMEMGEDQISTSRFDDEETEGSGGDSSDPDYYELEDISHLRRYAQTYAEDDEAEDTEKVCIDAWSLHALLN